MAKERGHRIAVAGKQFLQVGGGLAQPVEGEGHVFNNNGCAHGPHAAHRGQNALADEPQLGEFLWLVGKGVGAHKGYAAEGCVDGGNVLFQLLVGRGAGFHQQGAHVVAQGFQPFGQAGGAFNRTQGGSVHELCRRYGQGCHGRGQIAGGLDRGQKQQGRCLEGGFFHSAVGHLGNKAQRAFRAHHDVLQNFKGVFVIHQGVEAVTRGVLDLELAADAVGQLRLIHDLFAQVAETIENMGVGAGKGGAAFGVCRIQQRAVGQHHARRNHGLVRIVRSAAAHAAGIVGKNAADKAAVDGRRVGPDFFAKFCQNFIGARADDAGLQGNALCPLAHAPVAPALADAHQHRIRHRLPRKACARRAKGHGHAHAVGQTHQLYHFSLVQHIHHDFGNQAVYAGVCAVGQQAQWVCMDAVFGDKIL